MRWVPAVRELRQVLGLQVPQASSFPVVGNTLVILGVTQTVFASPVAQCTILHTLHNSMSDIVCLQGE
jgi:hypothetical protein